MLHASGSGMLARMGEVVQAGGQAAPALKMIEEALQEAQLEREQIERVAVGLGPGSYTGIRSAIALAQGWQMASGRGATRLQGMSSVECLAAQAHGEGIAGRVGIVMDAQRNEFYLAIYDLRPEGWAELEPLRLASLAEVAAYQAAGLLLIGPEIAKWFAGSRAMFPRAAMLARQALSRTDFVPAEKLEPIYLRDTQFVKAAPPRIAPA